MKHRKRRQDVCINWCVLQKDDTGQGRSGIFEKEAGVGRVEVRAFADDPDERQIANHQKQESGVDFKTTTQASRQDCQPALFAQRAAIGQHAGIAGHEHEDFGGVAEAVIAKC